MHLLQVFVIETPMTHPINQADDKRGKVAQDIKHEGQNIKHTAFPGNMALIQIEKSKMKT